MTKKLFIPLALLMIVSMILSACATTAPVTQAVVAPPTTVPATEVPATTVPPTAEPAPDIAVLYNAVIASLPSGYAGMKPADVSAAMASATPPFLLDVRDAAEVQKDGYIKGAVNLPVRTVTQNLNKLPALDAKIIVYCGSGQRGGMLLGALRLLGYTNVYNMSGGLGAWKTANLAVETGSMPAEAKAISTPIVSDKALFELVDGFLATLPDGFLALKTDAVAAQLAGATPPALIDLRTPEERTSAGYIKGSINIPFAKLFTSLDQLPAKDAPMIVYCGSGLRGSIALTGLHLLGYTKAINIGGGLGAWKTAKLPLEGVVDWTSVWTNFFKTMPADFYTIKPDVLNGQISAGSAPFLVDVREASEIEAAGFIKGAVNIPVRNLLQNLDKLPALDKPIVIYCGSAHRGAMAMAALRLLGYTDVRNMGGGFGAWTKANLSVEKGKTADLVAGTAPAVDAIRLANLNSFLSTLPDGYYSMKDTDVQAALTAATPAIAIDLRTAEEIKTAGYIKGSVFIPMNEFLTDMSQLPADKAAAIITVCGSGHRGAMAMMAMRMLGYTNVNSLSKGINGWAADKLPLEK